MLSSQDGKPLSGFQATEALDKYINRLEKRKVRGLTEKQVFSLIKIAKALRAVTVQSDARVQISLIPK